MQQGRCRHNMNSDTKNLTAKALELDRDHVAYAWATVTSVKGSAPRHLGSKMIITKDGIFGTIGGGALEQAVISDARGQMRISAAKLFNYPLGPKLGQCCGGEVDVFIEPVVPSKDIVVFGAGHISECLIPLLKKLNFRVTLVDERKDRIDLPAFDATDSRINELPSDALREIKFSNDLYLIVLTHAHIHDEAIVKFCLDKPYRYLGVIGSRTKWEKFKARYRSCGFTDEQLNRVTTPIGLDIGSESPFEIAVSIIAELIAINSKPKGFGEYKQCGR